MTDSTRVTLQIEPQELQEAVTKALTKFGATEVAPVAPIKIKAKFATQEEAEKVRELKKPVKVSANFELRPPAPKREVLHFPNPWGDVQAGAEWEKLSKEISDAVAKHSLDRPQSIALKLSSIALSYPSIPEREAVLTALQQKPLTVRGETIKTFHRGQPKKGKTTTKKKNKKRKRLGAAQRKAAQGVSGNETKESDESTTSTTEKGNKKGKGSKGRGSKGQKSQGETPAPTESKKKSKKKQKANGEGSS